ncbi:hypothetical protein AAMO2058_000425600 [Amorphochlora amoebiformis]
MGVYTPKETKATSVKCLCSHLTEFAIIAQQQSCQSDILALHAALYWVFIVPTFIFVALLVLTLAQAIRLRVSKEKNDFVLLTHLIMAAQCAARFMSCLLLSTLDSGFSIRNLHKVGILFVIVLPYSLTYLAYTYNAFQWIAIIHNASMSLNPFAKWWPVFNGVNIGIVVLAIILFSLFLFGGYPEMVYVGSFVLATLSLIVGVLVQFYGYKISKLMLMSAGGMKVKAKQLATSRHLFQASGCMGFSMVLQSALYMTSPFLSGVKLVALTFAFHSSEAMSVSTLTYLHWGTVSTLVNKKSEKSPRVPSRTRPSRKRLKFRSRSLINIKQSTLRGSSMSLGASRYAISKQGESRRVLLQDSSPKEKSENTPRNSRSLRATRKSSIQDLHPKNISRHAKRRSLALMPKSPKVEMGRMVSGSKQAIDVLDPGTTATRRISSSQLPRRDSNRKSIHSLSPFIKHLENLGSWRHSAENIEKYEEN